MDMMKKTLAVVLVLAFSFCMLFSASFAEEKTKSSDGKDFLFPQDALQAGAAIFALSLGTDRENGEEQQSSLLGWQTYFNDNPTVVGSIPVYHFPVLAGVPFFVKGAIRKALYESYVGLVDPGRVAILFISKAESFAKRANLPLDRESTLAVVASDGTMAGYVKGPLSLEKIEALKVLLARL